jgi:hypothetical protein
MSKIPLMTEVFKISEMEMQRRPPPGSQPVHDEEWTQNGDMGQNIKQGLTSLDNSGQHYNPYKTPDGQYIAYPEKDAPGISPMKADMTKGVWAPMTGSAATGTPFSNQTSVMNKSVT